MNKLASSEKKSTPNLLSSCWYNRTFTKNLRFSATLLARAKTWRHLLFLPYVWLIVFFLIPFFILLKISLANSVLSLPPYSHLFRWVGDELHVILNFNNYAFVGENSFYLKAFFSSIKIAFFATVITLFIGYPMAYAISRLPQRLQPFFLLLILLPSWTSFLIRLYAWMGILQHTGFLNNFLLWLGIIHKPLFLLNTTFSVYIGLVYGYLPFMILPLYTNLAKLDNRLLEASADLGAKPFETFCKITVPLSKNGIIAGMMLVFIPAVGEYVVPELLGSSSTLMIGKVLWEEFFNNRDWPLASALAISMLLLLLVPIALFQHYQRLELENK